MTAGTWKPPTSTTSSGTDLAAVLASAASNGRQAVGNSVVTSARNRSAEDAAPGKRPKNIGGSTDPLTVGGRNARLHIPASTLGAQYHINASVRAPGPIEASATMANGRLLPCATPRANFAGGASA